MSISFPIQVWHKVEIHTSSVRVNDGPARWGFWVTLNNRIEIASEGLQIGKFATEDLAIKGARKAIREYQREHKEWANR